MTVPSERLNFPSQGGLILYQAEDGQTTPDVQLREETVWLTQVQMVELFQRDQSVISRHVNNIFREGELPRQDNMQKMHIALSDKPVALSILGGIHQTFDGHDLYPSVEEKAAHLLCFVIKDHSFSDGNKHIGSFLFLLYLQECSLLDAVRFDNRALVALALLVAASGPAQKDVLIRLIVNLPGESPQSVGAELHD